MNASSAGTPALDIPDGQYNFLQGGKPDLQPDKDDNLTAGLVLTQTKNLTGSIDWWSIKVDNAIGTAPQQTILDQCVFGGAFCNQVQRDALGSLWVQPNGRIVTINQNLGGYKTTGVDFGASYLRTLGSYGRLSFNFTGTMLNKWELEPIKGLGKYDCAGLYGVSCGGQVQAPLPKWRHKARVTWVTPWNLDLALTWRHIDAVSVEQLSGNPLLNGAVDNTDAKLARRDYFDLAANWNIDKTFTIRGGINNLTDKDPPIVSSVIAGPAIFGNGNTFPQLYDTLGRLIFVNLTAKF